MSCTSSGDVSSVFRVTGEEWGCLARGIGTAGWLPWCYGLDGEEEGGRGKRQSVTPGFPLRKKALLSHSFFHLKRHR